MNKFFLAVAVAGTALLGGSVANAADNGAKAVNGMERRATDFSAKKKHHHNHGHHSLHNSRNHHSSRHWSHRNHHRYGRSYGYAPGPYYGDRYGYDRQSGPGVTFSFGSGRW